jgi:nucleotide-binding universal stress UspA family protein
MFGKLLIALDGSRLAECALAPAFDLAARFGSQVILLQVIPPYASDAAGAARFMREEAETYLHGIAVRYRALGLDVQIEATTGSPAQAITVTASALKVDLIVMSTHGRSGFMRLLYGSVAEAVLRGAHAPLMLVPVAGREELQAANGLR